MTYFVFSLGCKVNGYEAAAVGEALSSRGYKRVETPEEADIIVLNTCSVTAQADQKSRQHIRRFRRASPKAILIVMGCYSEAVGALCLEQGADIVLGTSQRSEILADLDRFLADRKPIVSVKKSVRHETYEEIGSAAIQEQTRAYLKIQDGCDNFCSYCIIPTVRGNSRSRDKDRILEECRLLAKSYEEIILTGIHIGGYGKDLGDGDYRLADLLEDIIAACPSLKRLRISSIESSEIDNDRFRDVLRRHPAIVDHLHIPLQSGSPSVLARMRRHYDEATFLESLRALRAIRPDIAITTDVIVGFPGETEEEFLTTLDTCRKAEFAEIHVFPFSARKGTYAAALKDQVAPDIKKERVHRLLALSKELRKAYESRFYGTKVEVLFEDYDAERKIAYGHTGNYLKVALSSRRPLHGEFLVVDYDENSAAD